MIHINFYCLFSIEISLGLINQLCALAAGFQSTESEEREKNSEVWLGCFAIGRPDLGQ